MEPVRVKVYGLFSRTRRRYLRESIFGLIVCAALWIAWIPFWPLFKERIDTIQKAGIELGKGDLPVAMKVMVAVLEAAPWILLATALFKCLEMFLVLRCFARKEAERSRQGTSPPTQKG
jgi:hypothetical protein